MGLRDYVEDPRTYLIVAVILTPIVTGLVELLTGGTVLEGLEKVAAPTAKLGVVTAAVYIASAAVSKGSKVNGVHA